MPYGIRSALITITAGMLLGSGAALAASNACKADINGDLVVNFGDLAVLKSVFFQRCSDPGPRCGDGIVQGPEECDDGNLANGDGCSSSCTIEVPLAVVCGNGIAQGPTETCDDGNRANGDGCSSTCQIERPGTKAGARFYVVGKNLVDPEGRKFFPIGANLISSSFWDFTAQDVGFGYDHIDKVKAWGWNIVRLPEYFSPRYGAQTNDTVLDQYIDAFTAEKIVVLVDFHSIVPGLWPDEAQMGAAEQAFGRLARKYKDNPYLWFELINEPGDPSDDGVTQSTRWLDLHRRLILAVRGTGAENVVVVMGSDWGQDAQTQAVLQKGVELRAGLCNVAFSFHIYNSWPAEGALKAYATDAQSKDLALIVTEAGFHDGTYAEGWTSADVESSVRQYYRDLAPMGVGVLLWHGMSATDDPYGAVARTSGTPGQQFGHFYLIDSDTNPTNLTPQGSLHWELSHPKPDLGTFTGRLADSGCASAQ